MILSPTTTISSRMNTNATTQSSLMSNNLSVLTNPTSTTSVNPGLTLGSQNIVTLPSQKLGQTARVLSGQGLSTVVTQPSSVQNPISQQQYTRPSILTSTSQPQQIRTQLGDKQTVLLRGGQVVGQTNMVASQAGILGGQQVVVTQQQLGNNTQQNLTLQGQQLNQTQIQKINPGQQVSRQLVQQLGGQQQVVGQQQILRGQTRYIVTSQPRQLIRKYASGTDVVLTMSIQSFVHHQSVTTCSKEICFQYILGIQNLL